MYISEIVTTPPENISERVPLEQEVYKVFKKLGIAGSLTHHFYNFP